MKTLKYAGRFLMRSKSYTIINLLGLAFSLACCIVLMRGLALHRPATHYHPVAGHRRKRSPRKSGRRLVGHRFSLHPGK